MTLHFKNGTCSSCRSFQRKYSPFCAKFPGTSVCFCRAVCKAARGSIVKLHPSFDFFRHTSTFYKKPGLVFTSARFCAIRINFIAASKKNAPSRGESLWAVRSSFLLFKFFYLSNQAAQTVKTAVHSGAPPHAAPLPSRAPMAPSMCRAPAT